MAVVKIEICDTAFTHAPGMSWYNKPKHIEWVRGQRGDRDVCFFTDRCIGQAKGHPAKRKAALLIEPRCVDEVGLLSVVDNLQHLGHVLSYDHNYAAIAQDKFLWYPIGGCWIEEASRSSCHDKTKLVSMVASEKAWAPGHKLRHVIANGYKGRIDLFGRGYQPVQLKSTALNPYMFSVAIENDCVDTLFTEKLIDCFTTGTVPIYWGTKKISQFFNMNGVLQFDTPEEFERIMGLLSPDLYASMRPAIIDNFYLSAQYRVGEDWLFNNYPTLFQ